MRIIFFFAFLGISVLSQSQTAHAINLLPVPKQIVLQSDSLVLSQKFTVSVDADASDTILFKAVNRMYQSLNRKTGLYFEQQYILPSAKNNAATLLIHVDKVASAVIGADESYSIKISATQILLNAPNTNGALHGLETLLQLVENSSNGFYFPAVVIEDAPRFQWRGLMIDVARHFIPVDVIKRNIEAMAAVKMNVLHLHLSDHEGFRVESKVFPGLQNQGSKGEFYTQAQVKEMIAFAKERGIIIIPEFDLPGHSQSWFEGYPELSSSPGHTFQLDRSKPLDIATVMQIMATAPLPAMDPSKESTYVFLDKFFAEMSAIFSSPYMHIGADENNGVVWKNNPAIVEFMKKNNIPDTHALQVYFVKRVEKIITKHHKQMIGWEELFSKDLSKDVIVQVWQNPSYIKQVTEKGNPMLLSRGFYLDIFMPAYIYYNNPDLTAITTADESVLKGGEAAQWTEAADKNNIETRIWPRAAAVAERLWSPSSVTDVDDMYRRLDLINQQLDEQGLQQISAYQRSLRRYTNGNDITALKTFTDVLTPVKGYKKLIARFAQGESVTFQTSPLTAVSDIIPVDAAIKWKFRSAVKSYLQYKDKISENFIMDCLTTWQSNNEKLTGLFNTSAQLKAVQPHAEHLAGLAAIGKEAMNKIKSGTAADADWVTEQMAVLKKAGQPYSETELSVIPEIEALVKQQMQPLPASYSPF